jgi:hypothetical protein
LPENVDLIFFRRKPKDWTHSMQDEVPHHEFYVINLHDLKGSFNAVPTGQREKLWREFFLDPAQWWYHRSEKVTEYQSCQSSHVNGAITLVGINPVTLSWLISCHCLNLAEILFRSFALVG